MKQGITIRMGASRFDAVVRTADTIRVFDLRQMNRKEEHNFRRELVRQFKEAGDAR
jgi:hypothetical protein